MKPFLSLLFCWCSIACNAQIQAQPVDPLANIYLVVLQT